MHANSNKITCHLLSVFTTSDDEFSNEPVVKKLSLFLTGDEP